MKKIKFFALLLALCLVASALLLTGCKKDDPPPTNPPPAPSTPPSEETGVTDGYYTYYELDDGTWAVTASESALTVSSLSIPATFRDKAVTQIGFAHPTASGVYEGFWGIAELISVTIPASVKAITPYAFTACQNLASVTFAEGSLLSSIGAYAFSECVALEEIALPQGVLTIGDKLFAACTNLCTVTLPATLTGVGIHVFEDCNKLLQLTNLSAVTLTGLPTYTEVRTSTDIPFASSIESSNDKGAVLATINGTEYLFGYRGTEAVLDLSDFHFTAVFDCALTANKTLTEITFPASLVEIGDSAFAECSSLSKITFAAGSRLTTIGVAAFESCRGLSNLTLPESLESIGYRAFCGCESLSELALPASLVEICNTAFASCYSLSKITFAADSQLTHIHSQAFLFCESLATIALPASLTNIGDRAFAGCLALTAVSFGNGSGWQLTPVPEGGMPALSDTANNAYYLTDLYVLCTWSKA